MSTTLTYGSDTFTPDLVDGWEQSRDSSNIVHRLLAGGVEVTHAPAGPRTFTMRLVFADEAAALGAAELHRTAPYIDLESADRAVANGRYVVGEGGRVAVALDAATRDVWVVTVDATEVDQ